MKLNRTAVSWDRDNRNGINENWDIIENSFGEAVEDLSDEVLQEVLDQLEDYVGTTIKNEALNGDFSQGTNGLYAWGTLSGTVISGDGDKMTMTGTGTHSQTRVRQTDGYGLSNLPYLEGHKLYVKGDFKVLNNDATAVGFDILGTGGSGNIITVAENNPSENVKYQVSDVVTLGGRTGNLVIQIKTFYSNESMANGKSTEVDNILVINLTEVFGAGNEPSKDEMDYLLSFYENKWFEEAEAGKTALAAFSEAVKSGQKDDGTELNIVNGVRNGNFEDASFWAYLSGTGLISASNNTLHIQGNGNNPLVRTYQFTDIPYQVGDKIYVYGEFEVDNDDCKLVGFYVRSSNTAANEEYIRRTAPKKDEPVSVSGIFDVWDTNGSGTIGIYLRAEYEEASAANGKVLKARNIIAINLTEAFGAGNEPTDSEKLDSIIKSYPNRFFDNKPLATDWQRAITASYAQFSKPAKKALISFGIDDGSISDYIVAYPLFKQKGIKGTSWLIGSFVGSSGNWLNETQIQEMYENGWDFQCHTYNNVDMSTLSAQDVANEFTLNNNFFESINLPKPQHHAFPFGNWNRTAIDVGLQYRKTLRVTGKTSGLSYNEYDKANFGALNARSIDITEDEPERLAEIKKVIDETVKNKGALVLYMHEVKEVPDGQYQVQLSVLEEIIDYALDYINAGSLESVTHSELYKRIITYNA